MNKLLFFQCNTMCHAALSLYIFFPISSFPQNYCCNENVSVSVLFSCSYIFPLNANTFRAQCIHRTHTYTQKNEHSNELSFVLILPLYRFAESNKQWTDCKYCMLVVFFICSESDCTNEFAVCLFLFNTIALIFVLIVDRSYKLYISRWHSCMCLCATIYR